MTFKAKTITDNPISEAEVCPAEPMAPETPVYVKEILSFRFLVWAFFLCGALGVLIEGVFCLFYYGHWETHVTTYLSWCNALYGVGAVLYFTMAAKMDNVSLVRKVVIMTLASTLLELLTGLLCLYGIGMRAWDYYDTRFNFLGLIAPLYSLGWALPALTVCLTYRKAGTAAAKLKSRFWKKAAVVLCIVLSADILLAAACMTKWSARHYGRPSLQPTIIDQLAPDEWMEQRFIEWRFSDF